MFTDIQFRKADPDRSAFVSQKLKEDALSLLAMYDRLISNGISNGMSTHFLQIKNTLNMWITKGSWNIISEYINRHVYGCKSGYSYRFEFVGYGDIVLDEKDFAIWLN